MREHKGQSTLEYVLVLVAILLAIVAAANGPIRTALGSMFSNTQGQITNASDRLGTNF